MFTRNFLCLSLLKSKVRLNGDIAVSEGTITFSNDTDFESPNIFENISENSVTKCVITGNVTELIRFPGLEFIEYFEITATGVKEIPNAFFKNSQSIKSVKMHDELVKISSSAFEFSTIFDIDLTKVQTIGENSFCGCLNIKIANLTSITSLDSKAFALSGLEKLILSNNIETIPVSCFQQCVMLKSVKCGSALTNLDKKAFANCVSLTEFDQGEAQISSFGAYCFEATSLTSFEFKSNVAIQSYAFINSKITMIKGAEITIMDHGLACCLKLIKIECQRLIIYQSGFYGDLAFEEINATAIRVFKFGLCGCTHLKTIVGYLEVVDQYAFQNCISLTSIDISRINEIPQGLFAGCTNLVSVKFSPNVRSASEKCFVGCEKLVLNEISFSSTMCFANCNSLKKVVFTGTQLYDKTFYNCVGLVSFNATQNIREIPNGCFQNCINLVSVSLFNYVNLKPYAFCNTSIKSLDGILISKFASYALAYTPITEGYLFSDGYSNALNVYYRCPNLKTIRINYPSDYNPNRHRIEEINSVSECPEFSKYIINRDDALYFENGVLYFNKSKTIIISVASKGLPETFVIPETVKRISKSSFSSAVSCKKIIIKHDGVKVFCPSFYSGLEELVFDPKEPNYMISIDFYWIRSSLVTIRLNGKANLDHDRILLDNNLNLENLILHESILKNCDYFEIKGSPKFKGIDISKLGASLNREAQYIIHAGGEYRWNQIYDDKEEIRYVRDLPDVLDVERILIPDTVKRIMAKTFRKYKNAKKIKFSPILEEIGAKAFDGCQFEELEFPATLKTIGKGAFRYSPLKKVTLEGGENHQYLKIVDNQLIERSTGRLILTFGELPKELRLSDEVKHVEYYSLKSTRTKKYEEGRVDYKGVETLIIPASVTLIESGFMGESSYISSICFEGKPPVFSVYDLESDSDQVVVYGYPGNFFRMEQVESPWDNDFEIPVIDPKLYSENYTGSLKQNRASNSYLMYNMPINYRKCADQSVDQLDMNTPPGYSFGGGGDGFGYGGFAWRGFTALGLALLILCIVLSCVNIILVVYIIYKKHKKDDEEEEEPEAQFNQETVGIGTVTGQETTNDNPLYMQGTADDAFADDFRDSDSF